jgi:SAM-dependent methyltransferase
VKSFGVLTNLVFAAWLIDAARKWHLIGGFLRAGGRVLEVGAGLGSVSAVLRQRGVEVVSLDVEEAIFGERAAFTLYDGRRMPFLTATFDAALLLTVLHHCYDPEAVLREALRVARRVIVLEDIYVRVWQRRLTHFVDSLVNLQFVGHPHNNRAHESWLALFGKLNAPLIHSSQRRFFWAFRQALYVLESPCIGSIVGP